MSYLNHLEQHSKLVRVCGQRGHKQREGSGRVQGLVYLISQPPVSMSSRENSWEFTVQRAAVWCLVFHIPTVWYFYELQETICTLKEENLHLQHRLENISWVIRDLKHLLLDHFKVGMGQNIRLFIPEGALNFFPIQI